jgi:hypothetical protein
VDPGIQVLSFLELQPEPALVIRPSAPIEDPRHAAEPGSDGRADRLAASP